MLAILLLRTAALTPGETRVVEAMLRGHLARAGAPALAPERDTHVAADRIEDEDAAVAIACLRLRCDVAWLAHVERLPHGLHVDVEEIAPDGRRGMRLEATAPDLDGLHPAFERIAETLADR
ncbi:MAG: hypothetical protein ACOZNI_17595 [Myxococcota bacterium]